MRVNIDSILPPLFKFRRDVGDLQELKTSIKQNGLIEPLVVTPREEQKYLLVAGHRRWVSCKELGYSEIDIYVREGITDKQAFEFGLSENVTRKELSTLEQAEAYHAYLDKFKFGTIVDIGRCVGYTPTYILQIIRVLNLPRKVLTKMEAGALEGSKAIELTRLKDKPEAAEELAEDANLLTRDEIRKVVTQVKDRGYTVPQAVTEVLRPQFDWMSQIKDEPTRYDSKQVARNHILGWTQSALKGIDMELRIFENSPQDADELKDWIDNVRYPQHQTVDIVLKTHKKWTERAKEKKKN